MEVGQKVYLKPTIYNRGIRQQEYEIKSIGRKYIHVWQNKREYSVIKFDKVTLKQQGNSSFDWELYLSLQDIEDDKELNSLHLAIENTFRYGSRDKFTLDQLRHIKRIIDEPPKSEIKFPTE